MNKRRRVLITTTYNEMGIIIDTKAEEVSNDSPELDKENGELISRADAIRVASGHCHPANIVKELEKLPSAQPEIVRCKDCENWDTTWQNDWAKDYHYCPLIDGTRNGDWYCADAERRADERSDKETGGD